MSNCLAVASKNIYAIKTAVFLTDSTQMGSFFGACNVCKRRIKDFIKSLGQTNDSLRKNMTFNWSKPTT